MRNLIILVLFASVVGLGLYQYRLLRISLNLAEIRFDEKMATVLQQIEQDLTTQNELTYLLGSALTRDTSFFFLSPDSLRDTAAFFLGDFLRYNLDIHGIKADFQYQLTDVSGHVLVGSPGWKDAPEKRRRFTYRSSLDGYLNTLAGKRYFINIQVPRASRYLLLQLNALTIPSLLFILLIIASSIWIIRTLYWQRNINAVTNEFINNLTHELKTPVFSIGLASRMLASGELDPRQARMVETIRTENEKLRHYTEKVLSLAYLENRRDAFDLQEKDFEPALTTFVQQWSTRIELEDGSLSFLQKATHYFIKTDEIHLISALDNIMDNAVKYSQGNPDITLEVYNEGDKLCMAISDQGIGMEEVAKRQIFKKYYRAPMKENLHPVKGFGLGMSYVWQVIRAHKGRIDVQSRPLQGTRVTVCIPLIPPPHGGNHSAHRR